MAQRQHPIQPIAASVFAKRGNGMAHAREQCRAVPRGIDR